MHQRRYRHILCEYLFLNALSDTNSLVCAQSKRP